MWILESTIKDMLSLIKHRGPDDEGIYVNGAIGLGFIRLSILIYSVFMISSKKVRKNIILSFLGISIVTVFLFVIKSDIYIIFSDFFWRL